MQPNTSLQLEQVRQVLAEARQVADGVNDPMVTSALLSAETAITTSIIEATNREMELQKNALAAGLNIIPNYPQPLESKSVLKQRLSASEKRLADTKKAHAVVSEQLAEHQDQLFIAGGSFWFRRFHSSLAIASAAAFLAVGSHLFDHETSALAARAAVYPLALFGAALISAGCIPAAFAVKRQKLGWGLSTAAAVFFALAIVAAVVGAILIGGPPWPARGAP